MSFSQQGHNRKFDGFLLSLDGGADRLPQCKNLVSGRRFQCLHHPSPILAQGHRRFWKGKNPGQTGDFPIFCSSKNREITGLTRIFPDFYMKDWTNASTAWLSNCVPEQRVISVIASSWLRPLRYGRLVVSAS